MMTKTAIDTFEMRNGLAVRVRPLTPEDTAYLVNIFEHMSADSRYSRFHQPLENISPERVWREAEAITHMSEQVGFIAFADLPDQLNVPVGAARYVLVGDKVGEAAVSVRDDMQGQGIGSQLMSLLAEEARLRGLHKLQATIQTSNKAIIRVLNRLSYPHTRTSVGPDAEVLLDLT